MAAYFRAVSLCVVGMVGTAGTAKADWYALRNETDRVVIVREVVPMDGYDRRIKAKRLSPGETCREFLPRPAVKHLIIHDPNRPETTLFDGPIRCEPGRSRYVIKQTGGVIRVEPADPKPVGK